MFTTLRTELREGDEGRNTERLLYHFAKDNSVAQTPKTSVSSIDFTFRHMQTVVSL